MSRQDEKLDEMLRDLPRLRASSDFTETLMRRYREPKRGIDSNYRFVFAVAAAAAVVAISVTSLFWYKHHLNERAKMAEELLAIKSEYAGLVQQYDGYQGAVADFAVLRLGGDRETEIVLDIGNLDDLSILEEGACESPQLSGIGKESDLQGMLPVGGYVI